MVCSVVVVVAKHATVVLLKKRVVDKRQIVPGESAGSINPNFFPDYALSNLLRICVVSSTTLLSASASFTPFILSQDGHVMPYLLMQPYLGLAS